MDEDVDVARGVQMLSEMIQNGNNYDLYKDYPLIEAEWDGQVCMTMDKIISYINQKYYYENVVA